MNYDLVYVCDTSLHLVECAMEENRDKNEETLETSHAEGDLSCQKYVVKTNTLQIYFEHVKYVLFVLISKEAKSLDQR